MSWRDTLFFWQGELVVDPRDSSWSFQGSWSGADAPKAPKSEDDDLCPSPDTFSADANNTFAISGYMTRSFHEPRGTEITTQRGSYQLDNGEGHEEHTDDVHDLRLFAIPAKRIANIVATGENEFGPFIAIGQTTEGSFRSQPGQLPTVCDLVLARRYIDEKDRRRKMSAEDIMALVPPKLALGLPFKPWNAPVLAVKFKAPKEKQQRAWMNVQALKINPVVGFRPQDLLEETTVEEAGGEQEAGTAAEASAEGDGTATAAVDADDVAPGADGEKAEPWALGPEEGERPAKKARA